MIVKIDVDSPFTKKIIIIIIIDVETIRYLLLKIDRKMVQAYIFKYNKLVFFLMVNKKK